MNRIEIEKLLDENQEFRENLFVRGYLITEKQFDLSKFPFYNNWNLNKIGKFNIITHKKIKFTCVTKSDLTVFSIGSFLNPFDNLYNEDEILDKLIDKALLSIDDAIDYMNCLTGDFILGSVHNDNLNLCTDPAGMLFSCYGIIDGTFYASSHAQLIADLTGVQKNEYTKEFEKYRYFYKYGLFFPGNMTQFEGLTRLVQNHIFKYDGNSISLKRFYPTNDLQLIEDDYSYNKLVEDVKDILSNTMRLASEKWDNIAISMTGGMDSKTTLACTNNYYDKFKYYSYVSMEGDKRDAYAAKEIAKSIGIKHEIYNIPNDNGYFKSYEIEKAIIEHNNGNYKINENDIRKRIYFRQGKQFDVEVKSWVSEIARANYYKKFGLHKMPQHLTARNMSAMFKVFLTERKLMKKTDKIFEQFIVDTGFNNFPNNYDESDMYLWEFRYSAWGGMVITSEHSYSNEIFIPFNNRLLLDTMLKAPLDKRISDEFHKDIIKCANDKIDKTGITITNWNETKKRMYVEKAYFLLNSFFKNI